MMSGPRICWRRGEILGAVSVGVVVTLAPDELKRAIFHPAVHYQDRLAAQHCCGRGQVGQPAGRHRSLDYRAAATVAGTMRSVRCCDGIGLFR